MPGTHIKGVLVNRGIKSNNEINSTVELIDLSHHHQPHFEVD